VPVSEVAEPQALWLSRLWRVAAASELDAYANCTYAGSVTTKGARLNVRLRASDDELIRRAADTVGQTVSEFLTASA
jgi:hypothetical protein